MQHTRLSHPASRPQEISALFDPATNKRRAPRVPSSTAVAGSDGFGDSGSGTVVVASEAARAAAGQVIDDGEEDPSYERMLERAHHKMRAVNPFLSTRTKLKLKPPNVERVGSTRTCWTNFWEIADALKRDRVQVKDYFLAELGTTGSLDDKAQLVLKGRHTASSIESLLRIYVTTYALCVNCMGVHTVLEKNSATRLITLRCLDCASTRTVAAVTTGSGIVKRGERRKARAAAAV